MGKLIEMKCEVCRIGAPKVSDAEIVDLLPQVPEWKTVEHDQIKKLQKTFTFKNFSHAMLFTVKVGDIAETEGHHPSILTEWGQVTITWWTHKIKGLHRNDFIMAANTDLCYKEFETDLTAG